MDLRADQYYCLSSEDTGILSRSLKVGTDDATGDMSETNHRRGGRLIDALLTRDLLTTSLDGRSLCDAAVPVPDFSILEHLSEFPSRPTTHHAYRFFGAAYLASSQLRRRRLGEVVCKIGDLKRGQATEMNDGTEDIGRLFAIFRCLRPYYPRPYLCLFDSTALIHFLAGFGVNVDWIFGVRVAPFGAHCWTQVGNVLVNDVLDNVRCYKPIMRM